MMSKISKQKRPVVVCAIIFVVLLIAYFGSKFVLEVLLGRACACRPCSTTESVRKPQQ